MNDIIVFAGPSVPAEEIRHLLPSARIRPPAAMGDIYRAAQQHPHAIALIDGLFERVPAPWHKELLWAIDEGVQVFGASSMGALRAAELGPFGMVGFGRVHELFATGVLEDDDEVAVAHLGADDGFRAVSEAMVNIRETIRRAVAEGAADESFATELTAIAKLLYYPERSWDAVLDRARSGGVGSDVVDSFEQWLESGRVDLKREDARALLAHLAENLEEHSTEPQTWRFEHTTFWERAVQEIAQEQHDTDAPSMTDQVERVLDELRLAPDEFEQIFEEAFVVWLAGSYAHASAIELQPEETQLAIDHLRSELGLFEADDVEKWLEAEQMNEADLRAVVRELATVAWARARARHELPAVAMDVLRRHGRYHELLSRALEKDSILSNEGFDSMGHDDAIDDASLLSWWFGGVHDQEMPADLDGYLEERFDDRAAFLRALRREHVARTASR